MSNSVHLPLCPYYLDEKNNSITCEDIHRRFRWRSQKEKWMRRYCDTDWEQCPYAQNLMRMYERIEKGADMAAEKHVEKVQEQAKEIKKLESMLGKAEKRLKEKDELIEKYKKKREQIEEHYKVLRRRLEEEKRKCLTLNKFIEEQYIGYTNRFCFLMQLSNGEMIEEEYMEWKKSKKCKLRSVRDDNGNVIKWVAEVNGETKDDKQLS